MSEIEQMMIDLLYQGVSITTLQKKTKLSASDLAVKLRALKAKGYLIEERFEEKGLQYFINKNMYEGYDRNIIEIHTDHVWRVIVISDTHLGNHRDNLEYLNNIYDYALERQIPYVIHLGDIIEGENLGNSLKKRIVKYETVQDQVNYLTLNYPKRGNVTTMYILGNHDIRSIRQHGIDISQIITNRRPDMRCLGFLSAAIKLNNRYILLHHPENMDEKKHDDIMYQRIEIKPDLVLRGHLHQNKIYHNIKNCLTIYVPQLFDKPDMLAGAYEIKFKGTKSIEDIDDIKITPLIFSPTVMPYMNYQEVLAADDSILDDDGDMSQVEKFQKKLGKMQK